MAADKEVSFTIRAKDAASAALKQVQSEAGKTVEKLFSFKDILKGLTGLTAGLTLANLIKDMVDLGIASDKAFRQMAANLPTAHEGFAQLRQDLDSIANASGRAREEIQSAAVEITRLGVSNASEVSARLKAATEFADATGMDLIATVQGLDQVMDTFNVDASQAETILANLRSASKGRVDVESMFDAFQAAAPVLVKLGIDANTATRALVTLLDRGIAPARAGKMLAGFDSATIRQLAADAHIAASSMGDLHTSMDETRESTERTIGRLKNDLSTTLNDLGTKLIPTVVAGLKGLNTALDLIANRRLGQNFGIGTASDPYEAFKRGLDQGGPFSHGNHGSSGDFGGPPTTTPKPKALPLTVEQIKAAQDAAKALRDLNTEADALAKTTSDATPKSEQFAAAIAKWAEKAAAAKMPLAEIRAHMQAFQQTLTQMRADESLEQQAKAAKDSADAWGALDDAFQQFSDSAVQKFDVEFQKLFNTLDEGRKKITNPDELQAYDNAVDHLRESWMQLRGAVVEADGTQKELNADLSYVSEHLDAGTIESYYDKWADRASEVATKMKALTNPAEKSELQKELDAINEFLKQIGVNLDQLTPKIEDNSARIQKIAEAWSTVGRSVIAAAQAVGGLDDKTAAALQNMVTLGDGIMKLFSGDILGGVAETVTSLAGLAKGLFSHDHSKEDARAAAALEAQTKAMNSLTAALQAVVRQGGAGIPGTVDLEDSKYAADAIERFQQYGGQTPGALDLYAIQKAAKEWGVTLDGSMQSYELFLETLQKGIPILDEQAKHQAAANAYNQGQTDANQEIQIDNITDPLEQFKTKAKEAVKAGGDFGKIFEGYDLDNLTPEQVAEINGKIRDFFHTLKDPDLAGSVDTAGLSIDDLVGACLDFGDAANSVADSVQTAADKFNEINSQLADDFDVDNTDAAGQAAAYGSAYGFDLSKWDLTKKSDVDAAIDFFKNLYHTTDDPTVKREAKQMVDSLRNIQFPDDGSVGASISGGSLGGGSRSTNAVAAGFQALTYNQGDRLADLELHQVNLLTDIRDDIRTLTQQRVRVAVPQPLTFAGANSATASSGPITIGTLSMDVHVATNTDDPAKAGRVFADAAAAEFRRLNINFGRAVNIQKKYRGDISQ